MNTTTISGGAVATTTCAHARVWRERPVTRLAAAVIVPVQGTSVPVAGISGPLGQVAFPAAVADKAIALKATTFNYMDVPPFRTGRPPV